MRHEAAVKIEDIHAMMASGHRSINIERHTLMLWGVVGFLLILIIDKLFTPEYITTLWQRIFFSNLFLASVLILVAILDFRLTQRKREQREETISFVQIQLYKLWWLIIALIVLINIGMNVYGGGYLFYPILLALIGMGLYAQGLFSQQMLSWIGVCIILLGLGSIALGLTPLQQEWLVMSALGFGFTLLAWWLDYPERKSSGKSNEIKRAALSSVWLLMVIMPVATANWLKQDDSLDELPVISFDTYQDQINDNSNINANNTRQIVRLPVGTMVPLNIEVSGNIVEEMSLSPLKIRLTEAIDVVVSEENSEGIARIVGGAWKSHSYPYRIRKFRLSSSFDHIKGPEAKLSLDIEIEK